MDLERQTMAAIKEDDLKQAVEYYTQAIRLGPSKVGFYVDRAPPYVDPVKNAIPEVPIRVDGSSLDEGKFYNMPTLALGKTDSAAEPGMDCPDAWHQISICMPYIFLHSA